MPMARWLVSRGTQASRQLQCLWSFDGKQKEQTCGTTRFSLRPHETAFSDHSGPLTPSFQRTDPGLSVQPDFVVDTENSKMDSETEWVDDSGCQVPDSTKSSSQEGDVDIEIHFQNCETEWIDDTCCHVPDSADDDNSPVKTQCSLQEGCAYGCAAAITGIFSWL